MLWIFLKFILVMCVTPVCVIQEMNHNGEDYTLLCAVLQAAVEKYNEVKGKGSPLEQALHKTIFGKNDATATPSKLKIPDDYNLPRDPEDTKDTRKNWCGACNSNDQKHYPGESATHDMVCLCTPGQNGHPISGMGDQKLCGQSKNIWVSTDGVLKGWYTELFGVGKDKERENLIETWDKVVIRCLQGGGNKNLKTSLEYVKTKLKEEAEFQYLGEQKKGYNCGGAAGEGVCVRYPTQCTQKPWWKELGEAIQEHEKWETEQRKLAETEKEPQEKAIKGTQTTPEKRIQIPQPTLRVDQPPKAEETNDPQKAEKLITNLTAIQNEDGSPITKPRWLLLAALLT